ncbi:GDSL lipase/esterase [Dillenia turbinata]|uniref:GDSL lipase/esterase n=1 Tax=Dillenia turbinata TaxID=194707 RepID=A0AAN8UNY6_9MAGN
MASCSSLLMTKRALLSIFLLLASAHCIKGCFTHIFSFGDSLIDTGNLLNIWQGDEPPLFGLPPYGETYFHHPTGRCSDGRVIVDFIAESLGLSYIPPYIGGNKEKITNIVDGVNFAVAAATVLDATYYIEKGIFKPFAIFSLKTQLGWFKEVLHSACTSFSDCKEFLSSSLFLVGPIGGNDYFEPLYSGGGLEEAKSFVPTVIDAISNSLIELIELGATSLIVPGCFSFGCTPAYLTDFKTSSKEEYDSSTGCLKWLNTFTEYHNELLQMELERLRKLYPNLNIERWVMSLQSSGVLSKSTPKHYESIFSFGDSLADTGNFLATGALAFPNVGRPPYGETFFHFPTAEFFELPFLPGYLEVAKGQSCEHGVNFAVAGATAINTTFFYDRNLGSLIWTNDSLSIQLGWFKELKPSLCPATKDCASLFKKSLFIVGEIGGNDFNYPFFQGATIEQVTPIVPLVIQAIVGAIKMLMGEGAMELMVPGNLPFGCSASYLTLFRSPTISDYDSNGCLLAFNSFSQNYNSQLKLALDSLRLEYPHANIIYADYYSAAMRFYAAPQQFGFFSLYFNGALSISPKRYESIISFGDSLADTGNFLLSGVQAFSAIAELPYGQTYFHRPTGRCSDGRLVVDFIAEEFGLPYLPPYMAVANASNFGHGVNFAVAGATALNATFFYERQSGFLLWTRDSLAVQLGWFKQLKSSSCRTKQDCASFFGKSLFLVGEIGGNDYNYLFLAGATIEQLKDLVPLVLQAIAEAISMLIEEGAVELMVPGNLPIGCSAVYLTLFQSPNKSDYDSNGCLKPYNSFAEYHNAQLKLALENLRKKYPHSRIISADYYGAAARFTNGALKACCGGGGPYNFNYMARCGHLGSTACADPSTYANWDGIHLTEAAYRQIAQGLLTGGFTSPSLK